MVTRNCRLTADYAGNPPARYQYLFFAFDQVSGGEPWNKRQALMISKDAAPIISFPMKNPSIGGDSLRSALTVLHEFGHYFGLDEKALEGL